MKTSFTFIAATLLSLSLLPTAHADHERDRNDPGRLASLLAKEAHHVAQDIEIHFPHARGLNHRAAIICRLADSTRHDVLHRHDLHATIRQADKLEDMLDDLEDDIDDLCDDHRYHDDRHVIKTVKNAESIAKALRHSLKDIDRHAHHDHDRDRHNRGPVVRGPRHDHHDHGRYRGRRPSYISFGRGGFSIGFRIR
ncbi:MAG: hypothetical protein HUJ26_04750 [Planctomycetaceae bacterium]|nr:hypothetical protein [Planctomycetaceae bacterium]